MPIVIILYADADVTRKFTSPSVKVFLEFHMQQSIEILSQLQVIPTKVIFVIQPSYIQISVQLPLPNYELNTVHITQFLRLWEI